MDYGVPFKDRDAICSLIRYHSAPIHCIDEAHRAIEISWKSQPHLLWVLAKADEKGRDTDCRERSGNEDLFRLLCEENNCFYNPYQFANKHARFLFFRNELSSLHYTPHESYRCTVYMMAGLPGSGKSTWRSKQNLPWVCLDELRRKLKVAPGDYPGELHMAAKEQCLDHLRKKQDFIFDATNLIKEHRGRWINLFAKYDSKVCCVYVEADWKQLLKQNQDREHKVPEPVINKMLDGMEMPCPTEFHEMKYIIGGTEL
jgi:predicted kinase